ncbi:MAG: hypothetical protein JWP91_3832 [Fibrobacteres bacterium]|nr:hypothetical protein [Fibrobacterota bacterium]
MSTTSESGKNAFRRFRAASGMLPAWAWIPAFAIITAVPAGAQFTDFQGGKLYLNMEGNMSPFAIGSNTGARGAMNNVTSLYPSASSLFGNPASLSRLHGMSVQTDFFLPGLGLGVSSERTKLLRNNMRVPIQDFLEGENNNVERPVYPDVSLGLYQSTNLGGFSVAFGGASATLGAGVQQPFRGQLDFALGGMRIGLGLPEDENDPEADSIKVLISGDAFARVSAELNDFSLGVAGEPWKGVHLGLAYQRYTLDLLLEAGARVDGILQRAGQESYFHGTGVNYHDDLDAKGLGKVSGSAHGVRMGAAWQFSRHFGADAMVSLAETMFLKGTVAWEYNVLPSLDFSGEKIMDPAKMNPTKLTLTTRSKTQLQDMRVNLPWEGAVSLHTNWENFRMNLDYSYFMRGMTVHYTMIDSVDAFDSTTKDVYKDAFGEDSVTVSRSENSFRLGLEQQFAVGFQIYQVFFQLGGIFYTVTEGDVLSEAAAYRPEALPFLPTMNMGYYFPLGPNFTATVSLVAFPVSLFKTSVEYRY